MATENQLGGCVGDDRSDAMDRFPVGMRVLAVDEDETCRRTFHGLLRQCNYEVTTAESASEALDILRENRNKFDLVIVDVKMPEMDGFELLQHLKLEMHIPVIMVSSDADTELIKKGIEHGACDYLVKPINLEVFKTIWQHVFRRKKLNLKVQCKSSDQNQACCDLTTEGEQRISPAEASYENEKRKRKRSEQSEEDEDDRDDEHENGEPSTRKKPRLVWTAELHNKFAAVVEHLGGPETAQPKKILELMKVDGLKRANVASHLQKYRQQVQSDLSTGLRWKDFSYMSHINSLDGYGDLHSFAGLGGFSNAHGQMICSSNSAADFSTQRVSYSRLVEPGQLQNFCNSTKNLVNLQSDNTNQSPNCFQVAHTPTDINQLQHIHYDPTSYTLPSSFSCIALPVSPNHYDCNTSQLQENPQQNQGIQLFENQSSLEVSSWGDLLDHSAHIVSLHGSTEGASNDLSMSEPSKQNHLYPNYSGCVETATNDTSNIWWEEDGKVYNHNMDHPSIVSAVAPLWRQSLDQIDGVECRSPDLSLFDHLKGENTTMEKAVEVENSAIQTMMSLNKDYPLEATPLQTEANQSFIENSYEAVPNPQEKNENESKFLNREFGFGG